MSNTDTIAVYIDGDNISHNEIKIILDEIKNYGRIIINRVYGDWSEANMKGWLTTSNKYGITNIQCERINGIKNSSDIKLCVDLMRDLFTLDNITMFYIVTGDSDYRHVIPEIKMKNKKIHCIGNDHANISLISTCDKYTKISVLKKTEIEINEIEINEEQVKSKIKKKYKNEIDIMLDDSKEINISNINNMLSRKYNFDYREWGHKSMSKFMKDQFVNDYKMIHDDRGIFIVNEYD